MDFPSRMTEHLARSGTVVPPISWSGPRQLDPALPRMGWPLKKILGIRLNHPALGMESRHYLLGRMIYRFHLSPLAIRILTTMMMDDIWLEPVDDARQSPACYDPVTNVITLDVSQGDACAFDLIREARMAWFLRQGMSTALDGYQPGTSLLTRFRDMVALHRVIEGDQDLHALMVAWQMATATAETRDPSLWAWCNDLPDLAPVARAIDHQISLSAASEAGLFAIAAEQWFATARPAQCDAYMLDWLEWLVETHGTIPEGPPLNPTAIIRLLEDSHGADLWSCAWQDVLPIKTAQRLEVLEALIVTPL